MVIKGVRQGQPHPSLGQIAPPLDATWVDAVALRVAQLIGEVPEPRRTRLVDAATLASELDVDRAWVYANRDRLGVVKLGSGSRPRLRFDVEVARAALVPEPGEWTSQGDTRTLTERSRRAQRGGATSPGDVLAIRPRRPR